MTLVILWVKVSASWDDFFKGLLDCYIPQNTLPLIRFHFIDLHKP